MEPPLYRAAMEGNVQEVNNYTADELYWQITPQSNTVLHLAAMVDSMELVTLVLQKCPNLLQRGNNKLETPLHIAAKKGHPNLIKYMLDQDLEGVPRSPISSILRAENADGDTALHVAARVGRSDVVELLAAAYPGSCSLRNKGGKTPLYIAAERNDSEVVLAIMRNCLDWTNHGGPNGKTTLHAAIYQIPRQSGGCIKALLSRPENTHLIEVADAHGWLPIHYAAYYGSLDELEQLLLSNTSIAYTTTENINGKFTAIHIAAANGNVGAMKVILDKCPNCWDTVDDKGRNILDIARYMEEKDVVEYIESQPWSGQIFRNRLRIYEYHGYLDPHDVPGVGSNIQQDVDLLTLWKSDRMEGKAKRLEKQKISTNRKDKMGETQLIVAALIATVTFTAGFTVPGGYNDNKGTDQGFAVLVRLAAFKAFTISNSIAVSLSLTSVLLYIFISFEKKKRRASYGLAALIVMFALLAMVIAFISGSFAVLKPSSGLAVATCVICCLPILVMILYFLDL